jgi:hypothetical protein
MPEMWVPGATGPSLEDFVGRILRRIEAFAQRCESGRVRVEVELHDGAVLGLHSISPEPGYGLITLLPFPEDDERPWSTAAAEEPLPPEELMVPLGSIMRITLSESEERSAFGFAPPAS